MHVFISPRNSFFKELRSRVNWKRALQNYNPGHFIQDAASGLSGYSTDASWDKKGSDGAGAI